MVKVLYPERCGVPARGASAHLWEEECVSESGEGRQIIMKMSRLIAAAAVAGFVASAANAGSLDLTTAPSTGFINGAFFGTFDGRPAGTGFIDSFVRIRRNGTEQGYNTTVASNGDLPFDELFGNFTRDITLGEIPTVDFNGTLYKQFILDINEPNNDPSSLLSLDAVQIYMGAGGQNTTNIGTLGTLVYDMDGAGDMDVLLDFDNFTGSGQFDMEMLVPLANFNGFNDSDNVILYSHFGANQMSGFASGDGFEEWAVLLDSAPPIIPLPSAAGLGLAGLAGLGFIRRRR